MFGSARGAASTFLSFSVHERGKCARAPFAAPRLSGNSCAVVFQARPTAMPKTVSLPPTVIPGVRVEVRFFLFLDAEGRLLWPPAEAPPHLFLA